MIITNNLFCTKCHVLLGINCKNKQFFVLNACYSWRPVWLFIITSWDKPSFSRGPRCGDGLEALNIFDTSYDLLKGL